MSVRTCSSASSLRAVRNRSYPRPASSSASALPIPELAPVMNTVLAKVARPYSTGPRRAAAMIRSGTVLFHREHEMTDAFILGGVRTPVGKYAGSLSHIRTDDLLGQTMVWSCERVGVDLDRIEDIAAGCVNPAHEGMGDIARWVALAAVFPVSVPAATVNRFRA